jgi:glycosyltransferase involved in cell wall biosynthesis
MKLCLVTEGMAPSRWRLQPWRYLLETARLFQQLGHSVVIISNPEAGRPENDQVQGVPVQRIPNIRPIWRMPNLALEQMIAQQQPDALIWHVGLTSFLHFDVIHRLAVPSFGIFTSPIYRLAELLRPGLLHLLLEKELSIMHLLGLFIPTWAIRRQMQKAGLRQLITLSETTRQGLIQRGVTADRLMTILPGLDARWLEPVSTPEVKAVRRQLDFLPEDIVVAYAGPPMRLRGLDILIAAFAQAKQSVPHLKLLILSRRDAAKQTRAEQRIRNLISSFRLDTAVKWVSAALDQTAFKQSLAASTIVALPFELVSSDMPLTILEALALGKPVLTTRLACLPEMIPPGDELAASGDVQSLARALQHLVADPAGRAARADRARQFAEQWGSWEDRSVQWEQVLQRL